MLKTLHMDALSFASCGRPSPPPPPIASSGSGGRLHRSKSTRRSKSMDEPNFSSFVRRWSFRHKKRDGAAPSSFVLANLRFPVLIRTAFPPNGGESPAGIRRFLFEFRLLFFSLRGGIAGMDHTERSVRSSAGCGWESHFRQIAGDSPISYIEFRYVRSE
eukprot:m.10345 g.10345  ORF g.10345 m.10345 type:complete len:160 (+) comp22199_c0_seq3:136-615(+)